MMPYPPFGPIPSSPIYGYNQNMMPYNGVSTNNIETQLNNIQGQINMLDKRVSALENNLNSGSTYNNSTYNNSTYNNGYHVV
jgi:hypothetical protein